MANGGCLETRTGKGDGAGEGRQLRRARGSPEEIVAPGRRTPARECSPEEGDLRAAVVRRSQAVLR